MRIDIWSDFVCPWCYIGEKRLQRVLSDMGILDKTKIVPRAYELDPYAAQIPQLDPVERLMRKYGLTAQKARERMEYVEKTGRKEGIEFRLFGAKYTNTFNAHRLMKMAEAQKDGKIAGKVNMLLFDAFITRNLSLADMETLMDVGQTAGLDPQAIRAMLASEKYTEEVRQDEFEATERQINSVPYFVFENGAIIQGAASNEDLKKIILQNQTGIVADALRGANCGPDGCVINEHK